MINILHRFTKALICAFSVVSICASARVQNLHKVEEFEFHGMKLGMTEEQLQQGLVDFYSVDKAELRIRRVKSPMPITDQKNAAYRIEYKADDHLVKVNLTPSLDAKDGGYMVVSSVSVSPTGASVDKEKQVSKYYNKAVEQFGAASYMWKDGSGNLSVALWCTAPGVSIVKCDASTASFTISKHGVKFRNPAYRKVWMSELETWAQTASDAGSMKYSSLVNSITTHACAFANDGFLRDCKIGKINPKTVEVLDTSTPVKFDEFDRSKVYKVVGIDASEVGDRIALTSYTRGTKGKRNHLDIRTIGNFSHCELLAKNPESVTVKCKSDTFDVDKEWVRGLKNL